MASTFAISFCLGGRATRQQSGVALVEHRVPLGMWGRIPRYPFLAGTGSRSHHPAETPQPVLRIPLLRTTIASAK